jgi:hypothetical protein
MGLLKETAPRIMRVTTMFNPATAPGGGLHFLRLAEAAAPSLAVELNAGPVHDVAEIACRCRRRARANRRTSSLMSIAS